MKHALVVGAGLSGATIARKLAEDGIQVTVIDKRSHIGGNVYDYKHPETGILVSKYGAHIFHTNDEAVWQFVNRFSPWLPYEHRVLSCVQNKLVPVPVNITTVNQLFNAGIENKEQMQAWLREHQEQGDIKNSEDSALARVGMDLYKMMFENYTQKQWDMHPTELEPAVMERIPVRDDFNDRYFNDKYEALPKYGYTEFVANMLAHDRIDVLLDTSHDDISGSFDVTVYTGRVDGYFNNKYGELQYRSLRFEYDVVNDEDYQPVPVVNYPEYKYKFTRKIDYKKFYGTKHSKSVIAKEYSTWQGEPYYPVPTQANRDMYEKYKQEAEKLEQNGVYFIGRLAEYKYFNMDQAIKSALVSYERIVGHNGR